MRRASCPYYYYRAALGGLGAALAFFHENKEDKARRQKGGIDAPEIPPGVTGVAAAYTTNESWIVSGFHQGNYWRDRIRYQGMIGYADINLRFYGSKQRSSEKIDDDGEQYNIKGGVFKQNLKFRITQSNFFFGLDCNFLGTETKLVASSIPGSTGEQMDSRIGGWGVVAYYDSKDSRFTLDTGVDGQIVYSVYDKVLDDRLTSAYRGVIAEAVNMPNRESRMLLIKPRQLARDKVKKERQKKG